MATVVLFHSAVGRTADVDAFADTLRADGHEVHLPDLYERRTATSTEAGVALRDEIGFTSLLARAEAALAGLPPDVVFAGMSMGTAPAQLFAATRPGARGVVCLHGAVPPQQLGVERWPAIPVQIHVSDDDPWVEPEEVAALVRAAGDLAEVHRYPGTEHLFTHASLPDHDAAASATASRRVRAFLERLDAARPGDGMGDGVGEVAGSGTGGTDQ